MNNSSNKVEQLSAVVSELKSQSDLKDRIINSMAKELEEIKAKLNKTESKPKRYSKDKIDIDIYNEVFNFDVDKKTGKPCTATNEKANRNFHVFIKNLMLVCGYRYATYRKEKQEFAVAPKSLKKLSEKEFENFSTFADEILNKIYNYRAVEK